MSVDLGQGGGGENIEPGAAAGAHIDGRICQDQGRFWRNESPGASEELLVNTRLLHQIFSRSGETLGAFIVSLWRLFCRATNVPEDSEPTDWIGLGTLRINGSRTIVVESEEMAAISFGSRWIPLECNRLHFAALRRSWYAAALSASVLKGRRRA
jgi:hypothetical protein